MREIYVGILIIAVIALIVSAIVAINWYLPYSTARTYGWGKQVCITTKPMKSFIDKTTCHNNE